MSIHLTVNLEGYCDVFDANINLLQFQKVMSQV